MSLFWVKSLFWFNPIGYRSLFTESGYAITSAISYSYGYFMANRTVMTSILHVEFNYITGKNNHLKSTIYYGIINHNTVGSYLNLMNYQKRSWFDTPTVLWYFKGGWRMRVMSVFDGWWGVVLSCWKWEIFQLDFELWNLCSDKF